MPKAWQATWALGTKTQATATPRFQSINSACLEKNQDVTHTGGPTLRPSNDAFLFVPGTVGDLSNLDKNRFHYPWVRLRSEN